MAYYVIIWAQYKIESGWRFDASEPVDWVDGEGVVFKYPKEAWDMYREAQDMLCDMEAHIIVAMMKAQARDEMKGGQKEFDFVKAIDNA